MFFLGVGHGQLDATGEQPGPDALGFEIEEAIATGGAFHPAPAIGLFDHVERDLFWF
jgi:hypothetical protein